ncbi:hypothetical protein [Escherichia coli]
MGAGNFRTSTLLRKINQGILKAHVSATALDIRWR